jgi:hypothetical protein
LLAEELPHVDVVGLRQKAVSLRKRLDSIAIEFADDPDISVGMLRTMARRVKDQLNEVETDLADAGRVSVLAPLINADDVEAEWDSLLIDKRRAAIDTLMWVVLYPVGRGRRQFDASSIWTRWKIT